MRYNDRYYFIFGVIIITLLGTLVGTDHSLEELKNDPIVPKKLLYNLAFIAICWRLIRKLIQYFDLKMPWETATKQKRWTIQLLATGIMITLLFIIDVNVRTIVIPGWKYFPKTVWMTDLPLSLIFVLVINMVYYYLWSQQSGHSNSIQSSHSSTTIASPSLASIAVQKGRQTHLIPEAEIAYVFRRDDINYLVTLTGERYLLDCSINKLENELLTPHFFRLNRQLLAQRTAIQSFQTLNNRHLEVAFQPALEGNPIVNKNKAAAFKRWVANS